MAVQTTTGPLDAAIAALSLPGVHLSVRVVDESGESLRVIRGVVQPPHRRVDRGAMVTARIRGGIGYAATADVSAAGLAAAAARAAEWARLVAECGLFDGIDLVPTDDGGPPRRYASPMFRDWPPRRDLVDALRIESIALKRDDRVIHTAATLWLSRVEQRLYEAGRLVADQSWRYVTANLEATASDGSQSQTRTFGGQYNGVCRQGGAEVLDEIGFFGAGAGERIGEEALELLAAPNCPTGPMDLLLAPDQMMLQIHESIGHPLELDRILGDERNFAGTSFVTPDMFGSYRYGSPLLNVTFDPTLAGEYAGYAVDDDGTPAERVVLIADGVLVRPLGGSLSQARAARLGHHLQGTANARACGWHRPPIDRMANLNVEPGASSMQALIGSVERGVLMKTNVSWSIDDSRNKFQFGCEWGRMIEDGRLTHVVRNPNYRGVSATFWRSLAMVGDVSTREVLGTPFCGKGEPGQVIRVGHASPACLFRGVEVFGAAG